MSDTKKYEWRIGDVFTKGTSRWEVVNTRGDRAVLRSCSTSWATTNFLTFDEWNDDGLWTLEERDVVHV
jgi:hypothetical protein